MVDGATTTGRFAGTKFHVPGLRAELLERPRLLDLMEVGHPQVIVVCAPAGFGKSTLVAQWLARRAAAGSVAWVSLDRDDDTLPGFWNAIVRGLEFALGERIGPLARAVRSGWSDVRGVVLLPLLEVLGGSEVPVTLVLDDFHLIGHETALASFDWLLGRLPSWVRVVLVSRRRPELPALARLQIRGRTVEIDAWSLRFDVPEAQAFLGGSLALGLADAEIEALLSAFDGWPAAMYLASLGVRGGASLERVLSGKGRSGLLGRALTAEVLGTYDPRVSGFLLRLSIFERFSASAAAEVLQTADAWEMLGELRESNLLVIPLDAEGHWMRLHHLLRDLLREELVRVYPRLARELWVRAGDWFLEQDELHEALGHYLAGEAWEQVARLTIGHVLEFQAAGESELALSYVERIPPEVSRTDPRLCFVAAYALSISRGDRTAGLAWLNAGRACARGGEAIDGAHDWGTLEAWLRHCLPFDDVEAALRGGASALESLQRGSGFYALTTWYLAVATVLDGDWERAHARLDEAEARVQDLPKLGAPAEVIVASHRAFALMAAGDYEAARPLVVQAMRVRAATPWANTPYSAVAVIAGARMSTHLGRPEEALTLCEEGLNLTRGWTDTAFIIPRLLIEQARAHATLGQFAQAAVSLQDAEWRLDRTVSAGAIPAWLQEVRSMLPARPRAPVVRARARDDLSERELEVLRMLAGPLPARDIASELFVSSNTLKSHCKSLYRKLGVSSRADAVVRARELTLIA